MVETEEFLQPALTHTLLLLSALSHSYSYLECSCTSTSTSLWPPYHGTAEHTHRHTHIFVIFIFSFRLLAWRFLIAMISFHLCFNFISFQTTARTLSLHLACADCSPHYSTRLHTHTSHTDRAGGLQPINMSERQRRIYIFALYVRWYECMCVCVCLWLSVCCPVARAHSLQWLTWLI